MRYIYEMANAFCNKGYKRFFMPGHKGKTGYIRDLTEADSLDDLFCPNEAILQANNRIAKAYGFDYATMATCGSTGCIHAMLLNARGRVLMGRNCHKSALNAAYLYNLDCEFFADVSTEGYLNAIESTRAQTLYITYPDYYGRCVDVERVVEAARKKNMLIIADCAHGAHYFCSSVFPALPKADMLCVSVHKTMGALTGGAALMCSNKYEYAVKDSFFKVHSTSPSYLIMESVDDAYDFCENNGKIIEDWIDECRAVREKLKQKNMLFENEDISRIVVRKQGYTGYKLYEEYKKHGIIAEMADLENVVFITSPHDIDSIKYLDINLPEKKPLGIDFKVPTGKKYESVFWCKDKQKTFVHYKEAEKCVCCNAVGAYPPGTAAIMPGEVFTAEVINYIERILNCGGKLFGLDEKERVQVVKL